MLYILFFLLFCINIHSTKVFVYVDYYKCDCDNLIRDPTVIYGGGIEYKLPVSFDIYEYSEGNDEDLKNILSGGEFFVGRIEGKKVDSGEYVNLDYEFKDKKIDFKYDDMSVFKNIHIYIFTKLFLDKFLLLKFSAEKFKTKMIGFDIKNEINFDGGYLFDRDSLLSALKKNSLADVIKNLAHTRLWKALKQHKNREYIDIKAEPYIARILKGKKIYINPVCSTTCKLNVIPPEGFKFKSDAKIPQNVKVKYTTNEFGDELYYALSAIRCYNCDADWDHEAFDYQKEIDVKIYLGDKSDYLDTVKVDLKFDTPEGFEVDKKLKDLEGEYILPFDDPKENNINPFKLLCAVMKKNDKYIAAADKNNISMALLNLLSNYVGQLENCRNKGSIKLSMDVSKLGELFKSDMMKKVTDRSKLQKTPTQNPIKTRDIGNNKSNIQDVKFSNRFGNVHKSKRCCCCRCCRCCR